MGYEFSYVMDDALGRGLITGLLSGTPSFLLSIAMYVFSALAIYTIATRRGIRKPWLAWIPVVNVWLLGSLSDQYRYVVKGEIRSKRKTLLALNIINFVLGTVVIVLSVITLVGAFSMDAPGMSQKAALMQVLGPAIGLFCVSLVMLGTGLATAIIRWIALYDVYLSLDPSNSVLFLVLSILFQVTEPFFLFFNRNKDQGMPPRREAPASQPAAEPWEENNGDSL